MRHHKFLGILVGVSLSILLDACTTPQPSPSQYNPPQANVQVNETQSRTITTVETIRINNCGGRGESKQVAERSFSVSVEGAIGATVGYAIVQGSVSAKYGQYRNVSKRQELTAPAGTNMEFMLRWTEQEWTGTLFSGGQSGTYIAQAPISVEQVSGKDLGCGTGSQSPAASAPFPTPIPPPAATQVQPSSTSASPLRSHTTVSIGSGVFSRVTFSDGQAPYDENWLWANNHFNIQRIRREEQPDGCDIAQYRVSKIWVSAASVAKVTVNGSEVGTISDITPLQKHGYIADVSLNPGDRICLSPVPAGGFHIVFGPDIYYHYDSYCYRGYC